MIRVAAQIAVTLGILSACSPSQSETSQSSKSPVQQVIDLDSYYFREIRAHQQLMDPSDHHDVKTILDLARVYHASITKIDLTDCPTSFREAYQAHTEAWKEVVSSLNQAINQGPNRANPQALANEVRRATDPLGISWENVSSAAKEAGIFIRH